MKTYQAMLFPKKGRFLPKNGLWDTSTEKTACSSDL
jgi:hypothetical protein